MALEMGHLRGTLRQPVTKLPLSQPHSHNTTFHPIPTSLHQIQYCLQYTTKQANTTNMPQLGALSFRNEVRNSSDWFATITPFPKAHLAGRRQELVTRVLTLIDNDGDGILDFVTETGLEPPRTGTGVVVITTGESLRSPLKHNILLPNMHRAEQRWHTPGHSKYTRPSLTSSVPPISSEPIKPLPPATTSHDESSPFPTATSVILTFIPFPPPSPPVPTLSPTDEPGSTPTTFVTITITSSPTSALPNPTPTAAPGPLSPAGSKTSMGIGIGVAVGAAIIAFSAVYCCCGKEKLLAKFGKKKKRKDKGKGRAIPPGQSEEDGLRGGGGGRTVNASTVQEHEGLGMERYRTPEGQQGLGICFSGVDSPMLSQQQTVGAGLGYSPAMSAGQISKSGTYSEAYISTPTVGFQQRVSMPTSNAPLLGHHNSPYSRTSLETTRMSNNHSPYPRAMSPQTQVIRATTSRQPRWTSFNGTGEGDGTGLGRPPVATGEEPESVVMSSVCENERGIASSQARVPHGMIEKERGEWESERFSDRDRDAAASGASRGSSKMLDPVRYYNGVPSAFTTSTPSGDGGSHYPSDITELAPIYTLAGFVPMPASSPSIARQGSSRSNTPLSQPQAASRKQSATFRPFSYRADSPVHFHAPSEPALIPGAERRPSSVTLTLVPPFTKSYPNIPASNTTTTAGTNGMGMGPGQGRISVDSASWSSSPHPSNSRGGSAAPSIEPGPSARTLRGQGGHLATEQVTAGVPSPLDGLIRAHIPRGSTYDEGYDAESLSLPQSPKRRAVQEWIQSSPSAWGDPEIGSVACGGTEMEFGGAEEEEGGEQEGKLGVRSWRAAETLVEGDSVSRVGAKGNF